MFAQFRIAKRIEIIEGWALRLRHEADKLYDDGERRALTGMAENLEAEARGLRYGYERYMALVSRNR